MKKSLLAASLMLSFGIAYAGVVKQADKDNDGTLDKIEVKGHSMLAKHFDMIDVDKDGTIDQPLRPLLQLVAVADEADVVLHVFGRPAATVGDRSEEHRLNSSHRT